MSIKPMTVILYYTVCSGVAEKYSKWCTTLHVDSKTEPGCKIYRSVIVELLIFQVCGSCCALMTLYSVVRVFSRCESNDTLTGNRGIKKQEIMNVCE